MDDISLANVLLLLVPPVWVAAGFFVVRTIRDWPNVMQRFNERFRDRAKISSDDWQALREQIKWLAEEVKQCRESEGVWITRAITAEAKLLGQGEVRQAGAVAQAEVRANPDKAPTTVERFRRDEEGESK